MAESVRAMGLADETEDGDQPEKDDLDEEEEDLRKNPPLPGHVDHHCTDIPFLMFFLLATAGIGWISYDAIKHGNIHKLGHGYKQAMEVCRDADFPEGKAFWCLNSTGNGLMLDSPICVQKCPIDTAHHHKCWDSSENMNRIVQDYPSHHFGYFCKPLDKALKKEVQEYSFQQEKGTILRLWGVLSRTWYVLVMGAVITGLIGYFYIFLLFISPEVVAAWCTVILTVLPMGTGAFILYTTSHPGSPLAAAFFEDTEYSTTERYVAGTVLLLAGMIAACIASGQRKYIEATTFCLDTAGDCLTEDWSILLEPLISVAAKVFIASLGFFVLFNLASQNVVETQISIEASLQKKEYIEWSTQAKCKLVFFLIYLIWVEETVVATSRYVMAYATEVWYFTEPGDDGRRERSYTCLLFEAYWNVLRYHSGSMAMGSFIYVFGRIPANVVRLLRHCGFGAQCCYIDILYNMAFGASGSFAYMDLPLTSTGYFRGGVRALQVLSGEIANVHRLQGALWIFHLAGVGVCTVGAAYSVNGIIDLVPSFSDPSSDLFIWDTSTVFISTGLVGLLIGRSIMLVFDTVFDTIIYCYALEMRRQKHESLLRMMAADGDGDGIPDYLCFLPRPGDSSDEENPDMLPGTLLTGSFAPNRLMAALSLHRQKHQQQDGD
eukprot:s1756_g5.t1